MNSNLKKVVDRTRLHINEDNKNVFEDFVREFVEQSIAVMCENDYHGEWLGSKIREHFGIAESSHSAKDQSGYIIQTIDGEVVFRVYDSVGEFVDYDIAHQDLAVTITDTDAYFYHKGNRNVLDYSPSVLGKKHENTDSN